MDGGPGQPISSVGCLAAEEAPLWTLRAVPTGATRDDGAGVGGSAGSGIGGFGSGGDGGRRSKGGGNDKHEGDDGEDDDDGGGGGVGNVGGDEGGRVGLAELYYLLSAAGGTRAMHGAETMAGSRSNYL